MTQSQLTAEQIAQFLNQHPDFFVQNSALFSTLKVPAANEAGVISFTERQIAHLQTENQQLKEQLRTLLHNAQRSEHIRQRTEQWACLLITHTEWGKQPETMAAQLATHFQLDNAQILLNETAGADHSYTGSVEGAPLQFELSPEMQSMAYTPLLSPNSTTPIGLLLVASKDKQHFTADMATDFLKQIAALCAAALSK